jgi:hypothetical protein
VRFGFHEQTTVLVVTFSGDISAAEAAKARNYTVLVSANGAHSKVPVSRVFYNSETHQATLRVAKKIYIFRPWQLVVGENVNDASPKALRGRSGGFVDHAYAIKMSLHDLMGPAWNAPGASQVGVKAQPQGPRAVGAKKGLLGVTHEPVKTKPNLRISQTKEASKARP